jgi:hypothetical protein
MRRPALIGVASALVVLAIGVVTIARPYFAKDRDYPASIPQPPSVVSVELVHLKPREAACLHDVVMDTHSERALFQATANGKPTVPLRLDLRGDGYRASVPVPASSYKNEEIINVGVPAPPRDALVTACVTNLGPRPAALLATTAPERGVPYATLGDEPITTNPWLGFYEARRTSIADRLPTIFDRMAIFRPPFIGSWLLWPLAALFVFGVPALAVLAYGRALRDDARRARRSGSVTRQETDA